MNWKESKVQYMEKFRVEEKKCKHIIITEIRKMKKKHKKN